MRYGKTGIGVLMFLCSCAARKGPELPFQVVAGNPYYLLRSPDRVETPFPETLKGISNMTAGWADLLPGMELKLQQAYFKDGTVTRGIENYLGVETVAYRADAGGRLRQFNLQVMANRPGGQRSVQSLLPRGQQRERYHRFFFQVVIDRKSGVANAVLLSANSTAKLEQLSQRAMADVATVCVAQSRDCTVFPVVASASLSLHVMVNGQSKPVIWGSTVGSLTAQAKTFTMLRRHHGKDTPVLFDAKDPATLRLPLMPNDSLTLND